MADSQKKTVKPTKPKPVVGSQTAQKKPAGGANPKGKPAASVDPKPTPPPETGEANGAGSPGYEVVSPPTPIDRVHKRVGIGELLMTVLGVVLVIGGVYISWPQWSPYIADYIPELAYAAPPDPMLSQLTDRVNALEAEAKGRVDVQTTITEMEKERARLQAGVKSLLGRLDELESAVGNVKKMVAAAGVGTENEHTKQSFQRIAERLALLEKNGGTVTDLASRMEALVATEKDGVGQAVKLAEKANTRLNDAVNKIENRFSEIEKQRRQPISTDLSASATVLAIGQLRKTILSGQPFGKDLEALRAVSGDDHGINAPLLILQKHADQGIATLIDLRQQFLQLSSPVMVAANQVEGKGWFENVTNRLRSFISIRQIDGQAPKGSIDGLLQQAEDSLNANDLEGAVKTIEGLKAISAPAAKVAAPWLDAANARLSAERAVSSLHIYAVSLIAASKE